MPLRFCVILVWCALVRMGFGEGQATVATTDHERLWPSPDWVESEPQYVGLDPGRLKQAREYALSAGGSGLVIRFGKVAIRWGDQRKRYDIKSATKSFGATMLGLAVQDGKVSLNAPAQQYHPSFGIPPESNGPTGWLPRVTILQLATQTAGFAKPGGYESLLFAPGTYWHYSDGGPNWLADCITLQYRRDLAEVMFERLFTPLGISPDDLRWRNNQYRDHEIQGIPRREFGAGIHANVEALSRLGYLYLRRGRWRDAQLLAGDFVDMARQPVASVVDLPEWNANDQGNASAHYGLLWWNNADAALPSVPRDAYWAWGLYDSLIVVIPSLDVVAVRGGEGGRQWPRNDGDHYHVLEPFLNPIVLAASAGDTLRGESHPTSPEAVAPYPRSSFITDIEWAAKDQIVRHAAGSDNWPLTWGDDGDLYAAYGDGWGFAPKPQQKLSLGLARVQGYPPDIHGVNLRSPEAEQIGDGPAGEKASGLLMVNGVLYMLVRNVENSQLLWSEDRGQTWTRADWRWTTSFGCPTFLNFGRDYVGAADDDVYIYSPDSASAYRPADRMVLARAPIQQMRSREAYEFFQRRDANGQPHWTRDIQQRGAVFVHPGNCYRSGITYNRGLARYLWCQVLPDSNDPRGPRYQGGFGIYESPTPWGPWSTVYWTRNWDVGPGETSSLPTKWMTEDGRTIHLVFSGNDHFSVRQATLRLAGP